MFVDNWNIEYVENSETAEEELVETHVGQSLVGKTNKQKYLGFVISGSGDNMDNINAVKGKSIGVIKKIMSKLESLQLMNYYFECAMIFMNVILRPSILYASETYYNLTEAHLSQIERIEEAFLRKILKSFKGCPIVQLYLEVGQIPDRFELEKIRLLCMQNILQQSENSMIFKMFFVQVNQPSRGDWASTCIRDLKQLGITQSLEDIKKMSKTKFTNIFKQTTWKRAFIYLKEKQGKKGKEIKYSNIEMAEYLLPENKMSISQKQRMFAIRNKMVEIENNQEQIKRHVSVVMKKPCHTYMIVTF